MRGGVAGRRMGGGVVCVETLKPMGAAMTVREAIAWLSKLPDKEIDMMIDCPYCGRGNQLARIDEAVILRGESQTETETED